MLIGQKKNLFLTAVICLGNSTKSLTLTTEKSTPILTQIHIIGHVVILITRLKGKYLPLNAR
jgi:hypothetical protein